jgi:hypothetical protein
MKYKPILMALDDHTLYSAASIANFATERDMVEGEDPATLKLNRQRIRVAMGRFCNNHFFPDEGDGQVTQRGQRPCPGWFGWRWKGAVRD